MTAIISEVTLGPLTQIPPGEGRVFEIIGQQIAVFHKRGGQVYATQAACPHRGGPLADGLLGGTTVVCPLHSRKFDLVTGTPIEGECGITVYPARLNDHGEIVVTLGGEA